jgi:hypothetical protein
MKDCHGRWVLTAFAMLLLATNAAQADLIRWSYDWVRSPLVVTADGAGTGSINLATNPGGSIVGDSNIVAVNLTTASTATADVPDTFANKSYALTLTLTDGPSQAMGQVTFTGQFDGMLTDSSASIKNTFEGDTTQSILVGENFYTVSIGPYTPPGGPNSSLTGSISAFVSVVGGEPIPEPIPTTGFPAEQAPEPSTLVLAALAVPLGALVVRRRGNRTVARS